ncbi:MAG: beta-galactosidase, partial [Bacteroidetes bacterium]
MSTELDLSGEWQFKMDSLDQGINEKWYDQEFLETVMLPGSMVENNKGNPVGFQTKWTGGLRNKNWFEDEHYKPYLSKDEFLFPYWLIPDKHYYGAAWYQKTITIPNSWKGKNTELYLERAHWETQVWIDGNKIGMNNSLGTAHRYDLSNILTPGEHRISICVDNRMK